MITARAEGAEPPHDVVFAVGCDGPHGLFPAPTVEYRSAWWPSVHTAFVACGWLFKADNSAVLCPDCRKAA